MLRAAGLLAPPPLCLEAVSVPAVLLSHPPNLQTLADKGLANIVHPPKITFRDFEKVGGGPLRAG